MDNFIAGYNMPGYMPDNMPEGFSTFDESKRYIIWEINQAEEESESEEEAELYCHGAEDVNLESIPFSIRIGSYVWWVTEP